VEVAISTTAPQPQERQGRPDPGAARAWTAELYGDYRRTVYGLCRALLRDGSEAEDATQQVFLSAHRALLNGSQPREPAAWLATIARNECWARARTRMREPLATTDVEDAHGRMPDPLAEAIRRADLAALWRAIAELPRQQRDALLLREFGGLSYAELAAALAVTPPAVESLLFRARQGLRVRLKAAYAGLTGASWIEAALRLLAGGSAPVATKAVALGLGAAALTGGAVVGPTMFDHHAAGVGPAHPTPSRHAAAPEAHLFVAKPIVRQAPVAVQPVVARTSSGEDSTASHDGGDGSSGDSATAQEAGAQAGPAVRRDRSEGDSAASPDLASQDGSSSNSAPPEEASAPAGPAPSGDRSEEAAPAPSDGSSQDPGGEASNEAGGGDAPVTLTVTVQGVDGSGG
jgi:RNA polymerase sigma factor (sigma-70 family)